jgi:ketose-bisphosphate aldolase
MPLEPIEQMMRAAQRGGYAVGYFESWNLESLQGVLDAAEQTRSPIIIGFNGEFLSRPGRLAEERLALYGALGKAAAESARVPCGFIFNECAQDDWIERAITAGFNLVMPADPDAPPEEYTRRVARLAKIAHAHGVAVEGEVGELPCGHDAGSATDPAVAARFVEATGVDLLAVSVGNVHIKLNGEQPLDLKRLAAIRKRVDVPFVLHGGTGIAADSLRGAIELGVTKVNYGTYLKQHYLKAVRAALGVRCTDFSRSAPELPPKGGTPNTSNPHELLGIGGAADVLVVGRLAVRDAVLERIELLGGCGKG